jgi:hypothetical protein
MKDIILQQKKDLNQSFCFTTDMWTSQSNYAYISLTVISLIQSGKSTDGLHLSDTFLCHTLGFLNSPSFLASIIACTSLSRAQLRKLQECRKPPTFANPLLSLKMLVKKSSSIIKSWSSLFQLPGIALLTVCKVYFI